MPTHPATVARALRAAILGVVVFAGCARPGTGEASVPLYPTPDGAAAVERIDPLPIGRRLILADGTVIDSGPGMARTLVLGTNNPDSVVIWGHDATGQWILWLGRSIQFGPDCYEIKETGYDRGEFITWKSGFALKKAPGFKVDATVHLSQVGDPYPGAYIGGGESPRATFCVNAAGLVTSVSS